MSQSGNDDFADARHALFVSTLCHAGQVVYLGVRNLVTSTPNVASHPCTDRGFCLPASTVTHEVPPMSTITTAELSEGLDDPRRTVVDIRPLASYNGGRRNGEARGGHIPGAVAFPAGWLSIVDEAEIRRLLDEKGITADRDVVVYGDGPDDAAEFVASLADLGIPGARAYQDGATAWAADPSLPLDRLPNYEKLVDIRWLRDVIDG